MELKTDRKFEYFILLTYGALELRYIKILNSIT